jgi:hypothetical protein
MASDNEHRLVSKVIRDRDIVPALQRGVNESWFLDDDNRKAWSFVRKHYGEYSEVPTAVTVKDHYPNYKVLDVQDNLEYLLTPWLTFVADYLLDKDLKLQSNNYRIIIMMPLYLQWKQQLPKLMHKAFLVHMK